MRLRRKSWIDEAIKEYGSFVHLEHCEQWKGKWRSLFPDPQAPLWVELGTGKGNFISQMALLHPEINFIGIEIQIVVLYYAAKKTTEAQLKNVQLLRFDVENLPEIFDLDEVDRFFINFCDPWPKSKHAKRRLTYRDFLDRYAAILSHEGKIYFKSDNADLFEFTLKECKERQWDLSEVTYDLHHSNIQNEAMTEYEAKFSAKGQPIFHCVAACPVEVTGDGSPN